jgi:hypothetical protein
MKKIIIIGGGTLQPISNHLSLAAPAYGTIAKNIHKLMFDESELILTKMADSTSNIVTNKDVENILDDIIKDVKVRCIVLSVAFCDYEYDGGDFHGERIITTDNDTLDLRLKVSSKVIDKIRKIRPDIFLVGFKTTTNKTTDDQFLSGLKMMKRSKCNLVLANDTVTRNNIIITPEESYYGNTTDRDFITKELVNMINMRCNATYNRTNFIECDSIPITKTSETFQKVLKYLIDNNAFIINNGNNFPNGHYCEKIDNVSFLSSQRRFDHNKVFDEGMSLVTVEDDIFTVRGRRKASVGARSQWLILNKYSEFDCIIHTHNPLKDGSKFPIAEQKPFQCGSLECGINTIDNMGDFGDFKAVYLNKHGANILFKSTSNADDVIKFITDNIELGVKTT